MADPRTLLQRLHGSPGWRANGRDEEVRALASSVRDNLMDLFSTRQGACSCDPDYGLPSFDDLTASLDKPVSDVKQHGIERIKQHVRQCVERHEPRFRIQTTRAYSDPADPFVLRFELEGRLLMDGKPVAPFRVLTAMKDQRISVQS